jgi:hypothetical protein
LNLLEKKLGLNDYLPIIQKSLPIRTEYPAVKKIPIPARVDLAGIGIDKTI